MLNIAESNHARTGLPTQSLPVEWFISAQIANKSIPIPIPTHAWARPNITELQRLVYPYCNTAPSALTCPCPRAPRPGLLLRFPLLPALALSCALAAARSSTSASGLVPSDSSSNVDALSSSGALGLLAVFVANTCSVGYKRE